MFHLAQDTLGRIESNLLNVRQRKDTYFSLIINVLLITAAVAGFGFFLYMSYDPHRVEKDKLKTVEFNPRLWNNAVRNVPTTNYGQVPSTENGSSVQGFAYRGSESPI